MFYAYFQSSFIFLAIDMSAKKKNNVTNEWVIVKRNIKQRKKKNGQYFTIKVHILRLFQCLFMFIDRFVEKGSQSRNPLWMFGREEFISWVLKDILSMTWEISKLGSCNNHQFKLSQWKSYIHHNWSKDFSTFFENLYM